jgi:hypothetical protein
VSVVWRSEALVHGVWGHRTVEVEALSSLAAHLVKGGELRLVLDAGVDGAASFERSCSQTLADAVSPSGVLRTRSVVILI